MGFLVTCLGLFSLVVGCIGMMLNMLTPSMSGFIFSLVGVAAGAYVLVKQST